MSRWTGSWLSALGPDAAGSEQQRYRGERLGLPAEGPGSIAGIGRRALALVVDLVFAALLTGLIMRRSVLTGVDATQNYVGLLVWLLLTALGTAAFGVTPAMMMFGIRVARLDGAQFLGVPRAIPRAVLVALVLPAVVWDRDLRGLHDKLAGTVVVNQR